MVKKSSKALATAANPAAPTLIDVARVAGVSPITVSRALNRPEIVSEAARTKVLAAVQATGYVPNLLAGGLASKRSRLVALFVPTIVHSIFAETVQALMDRLAQAGYQTLLGLTGYSAEQEEQLLAAVLGRRPDGIVLTGTLHTAASRERLAQAGIPVVESWDLSEAPLDMQVGFSHEAVGRAQAEHLYARGYRRFAVVSVDDPRALRRCQSLVARLTELGLAEPAVEILPAPALVESGRIGLQRLLARGEPYDVVVCSSDTVAQGVMAEAASRGLGVPEDLAVLGFGNLSSAAQMHPALSSVSVAGERMGTLAAEALLQRLGGGERPQQSVRLDTGFHIIDRATT